MTRTALADRHVVHGTLASGCIMAWRQGAQAFNKATTHSSSSTVTAAHGVIYSGPRRLDFLGGHDQKGDTARNLDVLPRGRGHDLLALMDGLWIGCRTPIL